MICHEHIKPCEMWLQFKFSNIFSFTANFYCTHMVPNCFSKLTNTLWYLFANFHNDFHKYKMLQLYWSSYMLHPCLLTVFIIYISSLFTKVIHSNCTTNIVTVCVTPLHLKHSIMESAYHIIHYPPVSMVLLLCRKSHQIYTWFGCLFQFGYFAGYGKSFDDSIGAHPIHFLEPLLLTRNNFNPSMNKKSHVQ